MSKGPTITPANSPASAASTGLFYDLTELYRGFSPARRRHFFRLLGLMLVGAFAELATIGTVLPFLALLADPGSLGRYPVAIQFFDFFGATDVEQRLYAATALFILMIIISGAVRFELARSIQLFNYRLAHELLLEVQRRFLLQPYSFHIARNSSTLISSLEKAEILVCEVLISLMQAAISAFMGMFIVGALLVLAPFAAIFTAVAFVTIYVLVSVVAKGRLAENSAVVARGFDERLRIVQESLGGIRNVIIDGSQSVYLDLFDAENSKLNVARANTVIITSSPRFIIETVGVVAIAAIALFQTQRAGSLVGALPVLGAIALGAQRLLPLVQQVFKGWSTASGYLSVVGQTVELLRLPIANGAMTRPAKALGVKDKLSIMDVAFEYPARRVRAVEGVSFDIPAGSALALVGETGSGKSTLADLLMGLIDPSQGEILIDGIHLTDKNRRRWQASIAHVPQSIFLGDTTIARNIALGRHDEPVDLARVERAATAAQLHDFVVSLPDGYETLVGERGIRLSGGQRQRLGIARAIYKETPVLVLDEATSALDEETEAAVMDALHSLGDGRTLIIIAHRLSTIARCDRVVRLHNGRMAANGTFEEVIGRVARQKPRASSRR